MNPKEVVKLLHVIGALIAMFYTLMEINLITCLGDYVGAKRYLWAVGRLLKTYSNLLEIRSPLVLLGGACDLRDQGLKTDPKFQKQY